MTPAETQQLKALLVATAMYYAHELTDDVLSLFVEDLEDLPFAAVAQAIRDVRRDPKTTRCPLPAVIRSRIHPVETDEGQAVAAVARLIEAVGRYGWVHPEEAKAYCGELAWSVVRADGGWQKVCETLTVENLGTCRAQWKQIAASNALRSRAGTLNDAPALPTPKYTGIDMTKLLPEMP